MASQCENTAGRSLSEGRATKTAPMSLCMHVQHEQQMTGDGLHCSRRLSHHLVCVPCRYRDTSTFPVRLRLFLSCVASALGNRIQHWRSTRTTTLITAPPSETLLPQALWPTPRRSTPAPPADFCLHIPGIDATFKER